MKKLLSLVLTVVLLTSIMAGCASGGSKKIKIGVSIANFDDTFLTYMMDGMKAFEKEHEAEIEIEYADAKEDMAKQMSQVENFIVQQKDAIIIVPVDTSASGPLTDAANEAEIPLVYVNRFPGELPDNTYYVGSEEIVAGELQMNWLAKELDGKGNLAILMGKLDNEGALKRTEGNEGILKDYPDMKILDKQTGKWQRDLGMTVTEDWLNRFGAELNAIVSNNDDMALGAIQALKDAGRDDIYVLGVDATPDGLAALEEGTLSATVFQDAAGQGGGSVEVAFKAAKGESVDKQTWIPFQLVTPENLSDFK